MNHFQSLLSVPTLTIESAICPMNLPPPISSQQQSQEQQQEQQQQQQQQAAQQQHQSVIMNSSGAVGEPSSSSFASVADLHGITECCESSSPNIPFNTKRSIDDHRGEINEYDVQKRIKRPMNAFMVWSQMRRAQIASTDVKMHNSQISKELGAEWREMSAEEKAPYVKRVCSLSSFVV
ncbi:unnamed protein product [Wuchereria bancrofti]|uniref:Sex-determining region Y protein n=1 Tax=Wuchereria bancrofti TaxID=6293 RepID=A0A3P7DR20_WUCBA|nr:unnamed protein product [Wuchereria bancrofti]